MNINDQARFNQVYQAYLNELTLQGKSPKTVDMYSRYLRQLSILLDTCPDPFTAAELKAYFQSLVETKSWSGIIGVANLNNSFHANLLFLS